MEPTADAGAIRQTPGPEPTAPRPGPAGSWGEAGLEDEARVLARVLEQTAQPFVALDLDGRVVRVNRAFAGLLGYQPEEVLGRDIAELTAGSDMTVTEGALEILRQTGVAQRYEKTYLRKDGRVVPAEVVVDLLRSEQGQMLGFYAFISDLTGRKQAEAALVASERRARALFEGIEDAVFVHDKHGHILDANPAASRRLGYTHEEFLRLSTRDIDAPDFAVGFESRLAAQLDRGHASFEGRHRTKDGRIIPVDINTSTIHLEDQTAVLAVIRDITERKALEETRRQFAEAQMRNAQEMAAKNRELVQSEARYRQLTEGSLDAVVVADAEGQITLFNPAAERTFGFTAAEVLGKPLTLLLPEELQGPRFAQLGSLVRGRNPRLVGRTVELTGRRKGGEPFPVELSLSAVEAAGSLQLIGALRDQTERHRMRAMLAQSEKLASIGLLSAGVAHEINNPLAYIANNLAVLERDLKGVLAIMDAYESARPALAGSSPQTLQKVQDLAEELDWDYVRENLGRMLARTREGVQRVANIVQNLRGLARTAPPEMEPASLPELFASALEMVRGRLRKAKIELEVEHGPLPRLACVPQQISQVILNLLINAIQAIESADGADGGRIRVTLREEGGGQTIEVADNGVGIAPEDLPRLFDPFFTTKPVGEGTGLGLSITHGIVTGHGGRIDLDSAPGRGTTFRIWLPDADARAAMIRAEPEASPP